MKEVLLINGPPRSGKDTLATELMLARNYVHLKFATPLSRAVPAIFSIPPDLWAELFTYKKEDPSPLLEGMSPRQAMIWLSEQVIKPHFGPAFFGRSLINRMAAHSVARAVISDSGFQEEADEVVRMMGQKNVRLIRLHRHGRSFDGDSRGYISPDVQTLDLQNDGTVVEMVDDVIRWLDASE